MKSKRILAVVVLTLTLILFSSCDGTESGTLGASSGINGDVQPASSQDTIVLVQEFDPQTTAEKNGCQQMYIYNITLQDGDRFCEFQQTNTLTLHGDGFYELQKQLRSITEPDPWGISITYTFFGSFTRDGEDVTLNIPDNAKAESDWGNLGAILSFDFEFVTSEEAPRILGEFATSFLGYRNIPEPILAYIDEETGSFTFEYEYGEYMFGNADQYGVEAVEPEESSPIQGKTILFLGSSVTFGSASEEESFVDFIAKIDGVNAIKEAVSGTSLSTAAEDSYVERIQAIDTDLLLDAMVCQLSTNDATRGLELGEIAEGFDLESFNTDTITGAIEYIICYTLETWNCPVVFYTNPEYNSADYKAMVNMLLDLQEKWDFTVIDFWNDSEVNEVLREEYLLYMADSIHPTKAGYLKVFTPLMQDVLYELLAD